TQSWTSMAMARRHRSVGLAVCTSSGCPEQAGGGPLAPAVPRQQQQGVGGGERGDPLPGSPHPRPEDGGAPFAAAGRSRGGGGADSSSCCASHGNGGRGNTRQSGGLACSRTSRRQSVAAERGSSPSPTLAQPTASS